MDDACKIGEKDRQIKTQINLLAQSQDHLIKGIEDLLTRLSPALRNDVACCSPDDGKALPEEQLVPIAADIRSIRYSLEADTALISSILNRLEI